MFAIYHKSGCAMMTLAMRTPINDSGLPIFSKPELDISLMAVLSGALVYSTRFALDRTGFDPTSYRGEDFGWSLILY
jgi:hypothetical protein